MLRFILLYILLLVVDVVFAWFVINSFNKLNINTTKKKIIRFFKISNLIILSIILVFIFVNLLFDIEPYIYYRYFLGLNAFLLIWYLPKVIFVIAFIPYYLLKAIKFLITKNGKLNSNNKFIIYFSKSYHFFSWFILFFILIFSCYAVFINRIDFKVNKYNFYHADIPQSFDNYKVLMFSDFHLGSFFSEKEVGKLVELINEQNADVVIFAGDLVNFQLEEAKEYKSILKSIKAKDYKFSVLGNHDMDDYRKWIKMKDSIKVDKNEITNFYKEIDFNLLNNEHFIIRKKNDSIAFVGVENWGAKPFKQNGKIGLAIKDLNVNMFKILVSHDPSHWEAQIKNKINIQLTLSGHTHGGQIVMEFGDKKISPISLMYKYYYGLYESNNQYLYVSNGAGYLGFPARFGAKPEIALFILKSQQN